jgi:hypothetical protein
MSDEATPAKVRLTDGLGAFFTAEMLKNATMTGEQEGRAYRGYCPKCKAQQLRHFYSDGGMVFKQCAECGTVAVLGA